MSGSALTLEEHAAVRTQIEDKLRSFLDDKVGQVTNAETRGVLQQLRDFALGSGKRMRPLFCYWGWRGALGDDRAEDDILSVAAAVELFHVAALIHDDIVDRSDLRRGLPTMHRAYARLHEKACWNGESGHFGLSAALLAGNAGIVWSDELFHDGWRASRSPSAMALFSGLRADAIHGEYLDLFGEARTGSVAEALEVVRYKTAGYSVRDPLRLGGVLAGAPDEVLAAYGTYGLLLGEAYQMRDDLFGIFGDPLTTGKSNVDDIRQGKLTVLITIARDLAGPRETALIDRLYGAPWVDDDAAADVRDAVERVGARTVVEDMISDRHAGALRALESVSLHPSAAAALRELAHAAVDRRT